MSFTISLSSKASEISRQFYPPIDLSDRKYELALIGISFWHSIPNITHENNSLKVGTSLIQLRKGCYDIRDIENAVNKQLNILLGKQGAEREVLIKPDLTTMSVNIYSKTMPISFDVPNSIAPVLGYNIKHVVAPGSWEESDSTVQISDITAIRVLCNVIGNSFENDRISTIIHEIYDLCDPGYRFDAVLSNPIYYPVNVREINDLTCKLVNENNKLVDLNGEQLSIRLHLRPVS
jgi:hypothetical protein